MPDYLDTWTRDRTIGQLSVAQRLQLMVRRPDEITIQLIDGKDASVLARYLDTSHWNGKLNISLMKPYIHAHMLKVSDGKQMIAGAYNDLNTYVDDQASDVIQQCYDEVVPVIVYHYWQPDHAPASNKDSDRQYQALLYAPEKQGRQRFHGQGLPLPHPLLHHPDPHVRDRFQT